MLDVTVLKSLKELLRYLFQLGLSRLATQSSVRSANRIKEYRVGRNEPWRVGQFMFERRKRADIVTFDGLVDFVTDLITSSSLKRLNVLAPNRISLILFRDLTHYFEANRQWAACQGMEPVLS
jgi:hypothetical protein